MFKLVSFITVMGLDYSTHNSPSEKWGFSLLYIKSLETAHSMSLSLEHSKHLHFERGKTNVDGVYIFIENKEATHRKS